MMKKLVVLFMALAVLTVFSVAMAEDKPAPVPKESTDLRIARLEASNAQLTLDKWIADYNAAGCGKGAEMINSLTKKRDEAKKAYDDLVAKEKKPEAPAKK